MYELEGWLIDGTNMASFALYEDGLTLFGRRDVTSKDLLAVRLDPDVLSAFLAELPIGEDLLSLPREHHATTKIDQVTVGIAIWRGEDVHLFEVYGDLRSDPEARAAAPAALVALFDALVGFVHPLGERWSPDRIEVSLLPGLDLGEGSVPWPEGWPVPDDGKRESGDSFHCVIDGDDLAEVEAVYKEELPVEIQGEVWDINYRLPIPNEGAVRLNRALWTKRG